MGRMLQQLLDAGWMSRIEDHNYFSKLEHHLLLRGCSIKNLNGIGRRYSMQPRNVDAMCPLSVSNAIISNESRSSDADFNSVSFLSTGRKWFVCKKLETKPTG